MRLPYFLILLLLFSFSSCKNRDRYLNDPDNMTEISDIEEVYASGIPQRVREIFDYYSNLDLSIKKNQEEVAGFKDDIYLFQEKFIIPGLDKYKVYAECGKGAYGMDVFINHKHLEGFRLVLSKIKNGYKLCRVINHELLYSKRKSFDSYLRKFNKKYWI